MRASPSYHAVKQCLPILTPDTTAVVIGVGGLGHLAEAGKLKPQIQRFALEEVETVYKKLQANEIAGRAVLIP